MSEVFGGDKLHEECGIFGLIDREGSLRPAFDVYNALFALQHRGQHSAGIAVSDGERLRYKKGDGLVSEVFDRASLSVLAGDMAIGHVRYASRLGTSGVNAQPITITHKGEDMALAFNGSLTNRERLRTEIESYGGLFQTTGDAEIIAYVLVKELLKYGALEQAVLSLMTRLEGAFSLLILTKSKLIAMRDPQGFRPLCVGMLGNSFAAASESCALDSVGAVFTRDVEPGEIIIADRERTRAVASGAKAREALCVFEYIYFARPDSVIDGISVELARQEAGRCLAQMDARNPDGPLQADVVIGVPDTGLSAALGYSRASGIPYATGLIKNRYIARTFIQSSQSQRERTVRLKHNAMGAMVNGKRVVMVDDSIVRGTTIGRIVSILRDAGAKEVHLRVSSPPFIYPCYFGTDIPSREVLAANQYSLEEMRLKFGLDSLRFLRTEDLRIITRSGKCGICDACFTGHYAVPVSREG